MNFELIQLQDEMTDSNKLTMRTVTNQKDLSRYKNQWLMGAMDQHPLQGSTMSHVCANPDSGFPCGFTRGSPNYNSEYGWYGREVYWHVDSRDWQDGGDKDGPYGVPNCDMRFKFGTPPIICDEGSELAIQSKIWVPDWETAGDAGASITFIGHFGDGAGNNLHFVILLHDTRERSERIEKEKLRVDPAQGDMPYVSGRLYEGTKYTTLRYGSETLYGNIKDQYHFFRVHFTRENIDNFANDAGERYQNVENWYLLNFGLHIEYFGLDNRDPKEHWLTHTMFGKNVGAYRVTL